MIGPGDTLSVFVYRAPELSVSDLPVRPDGRISVPLIPDIVAAGKTPHGTRERDRDEAAPIRQGPERHGDRAQLRRSVQPPGEGDRRGGEADRDSVSRPHDAARRDDRERGLTKFAAGNRAVIVRRLPDGREETLHVRLSSLLNNGNINDNVEMQPGDTLIIPKSWF